MVRWTRVTALLTLFLVSIPLEEARSFPIGVSLHGGLGKGYYSMEELNDNINELRLQLGSNLSDLSNGTNVMLQGRVWFFDRIGITGTYEHFWGETEISGADDPVIFKAPANIYSVGGILKVLVLPLIVDLNVGLSKSFATSIYGTNQDFARRLEEFKGDDDGYELFVEAMTNFIRPLQFGLMLGYRGLKIQKFEDRYGDIAYFEPSHVVMEVDYSGVFFYVTAGIGL
jgi:hypothetical protein